MPRCRFLFACDLGDPISCVYVNDGGCMAGTMMGNVWLFSFESKQVEELTAFSDEGIRGLYMDQDSSYATLSEGCRSWRRTKPHMAAGTICFRSLDKKNTQNVKHVLQRGPWACVLFPISSTVVNVTRQEHHHRAFKFLDFGSSAEIAPCDFDGENLVVVDRTQPEPIFRLVHLERNEQLEIDSLPKASSVTLVKLWGPDCLACVIGFTLYLYDYRKKQNRHTLRGHRAEIVAVDAQDAKTIATLSCDAVVKLWSGLTGDCLQTLFVPEASFFLGYPYCLCLRGRRVLVSADEGAYLMELDTSQFDV